MNREQINIDEVIEKVWASNLDPLGQIYEQFKKSTDQNIKRFSREQRIKMLLTECMLLRSMNRQTEGQDIADKNKSAFNNIAEPLFAHRWRRMLLIEKFRLANTSNTGYEAKELASEAQENGWAAEQIRALFLLHLIEVHTGLFKQAVETAQQVRLLAIKNRDEQYILQTAWAIAHTHYFFGNKEQALAECLKVKHHFGQDYSRPQHLNFYVLLAACYQSAKNYKKSIPLFKSILEYLEINKVKDPAVYLAASSNLAAAYSATGNVTESEQSYRNVEALAEKSNWPQYQLSSAIALANLYYSLSQFKKMGNAIKRADTIVARLKTMRESVQVLKLKALYQKGVGNVKKALEAFEVFHDKFEEWKKLDNSENLKAIELKHELEIQQLNQDVMKKEMQLQTQEVQLLNSYLQQKDKLIGQFADYFKELEETNIRRKEIFIKLREMVHNVKTVKQTEAGGYSTKFNEAHQKATEKLLKKYPSITAKEADTAVMLTQGLTNKDISTLTLTTIRNIEKHRLGLRRKMKVSRGEDLIQKIRLAVGG